MEGSTPFCPQRRFFERLFFRLRLALAFFTRGRPDGVGTPERMLVNFTKGEGGSHQPDHNEVKI